MTMELPGSSSSKSSHRGSLRERPPFIAGPEFYSYIAYGYDQTAEFYDDVEGRNTISERVRQATLNSAFSIFRAGDRILELGCGTGRDAVELAKHGIEVVATDVSPRMVEIARERARAQGVEDVVVVKARAAAEAVWEDGPYDGAYSNGAVLNLEPDLDAVAAGLSESLRPGAHAILTAANRISLFELAVYPMVFRPRKAFRKLGATVPIPISREGVGKKYVVPTRFLTPREFMAPFEVGFERLSLRALQALTPPWNLVDMANRFESAVTVLERLEDRFATGRLLRNLGAIYVTTIRRRET